MRKKSSQNRQKNKISDLLIKAFAVLILGTLLFELLEKMGLNSDISAGVSFVVSLLGASFITKNESASTLFRILSAFWLSVMIGKTMIGTVVIFIAIVSLYFVLKNKSRNKGNLFNINPYDYEEEVAKYLRRKGYRDVNTTPKSGDFGADVLAISPQGSKVCIQCKRYQADNPVGVKAVQEIYSAKEYYKCDLAYIFTTSDFTKQAREMASELGVKLVQYN